MPDWATVAIALGSNVGERQAHLALATVRLRNLLRHFRLSSIYETDPIGVPGEQERFLNAAAVGETALDACSLLNELLAIEREAGRERPYTGAARTLDLDLILFDDRIIDERQLVVPHPRFRERLFVLEPLAEIGAALVDPVTGRTVGELLERLRKKRGTEETEETA